VTVELVALVVIVLLAFIAALGISAWREVRLAQAKRPTGTRALFRVRLPHRARGLPCPPSPWTALAPTGGVVDDDGTLVERKHYRDAA
jgi:hypothetical protein